MGKVAIVTGGASGIGLGVSRWFARDGYKVAMLDRQGDLAEAESRALNEEGFQTLAASVDVTDRSQIEDAYAQVRSEFGPIEVVIANAGISARKPFLEMAASEWQEVLDINLTGMFHTLQLALPDMIAAGWGRIVTISSVSAQLGAPGMAHYVASKGGVIGLTKALSFEFAPLGITVNTIPPSIVVTPMGLKSEAEGKLSYADIAAQTPVRRVSQPEDIAAACAYLCSDNAGFVTGQQINVNGGWYV